MRMIVVIASLLCCFAGFGQSKDTTRLYFDHELNLTKKNRASYFGIAVKENSHWLIYAVYPNNEPLLKLYFKDAAFTVKDGPFVFYHQQKKKAFEGYFLSNKLHSSWQTYYESGFRRDSGGVKENTMTGIWKHWYDSGRVQHQSTYAEAGGAATQRKKAGTGIFSYESLGGIVHGSWMSWYKNGKQECIGQYKNDSLDGYWQWFREDGQRATEETYANGKLTKLKCYDENGVLTGESCSILLQPELVHPFLSAQDYIIDQLHRSKNSDIKEDGIAEISFTVTKEGKIKNLVIISSPDKALSDHIVKIFSTMPVWTAATTHNRTMDYEMKMEVPFFR